MDKLFIVGLMSCFKTCFLCCIFMFVSTLNAQPYQTSFSEVKFDRAANPSVFHHGVVVDPATGAVSIDLPFGPGIGPKDVRFIPAMTIRCQPQGRMTYLPPLHVNKSGYLDAEWRFYYGIRGMGNGNVNIHPGVMEVVLLDEGTLSFTLPGGGTGSCDPLLNQSGELPPGTDVAAVAKGFGFSAAAGWRVPSNAELQSGGGSVWAIRTGTDGELVIGLVHDQLAPLQQALLHTDNGPVGGTTLEVPTYVYFPRRWLVVKGELGYVFDLAGVQWPHVYSGVGKYEDLWYAGFNLGPRPGGSPSPEPENWWDPRTAYYRLTKMMNRAGEAVSFAYRDDGLQGSESGWTASWQSAVGGEQRVEASASAVVYFNAGAEKMRFTFSGGTPYLSRGGNVFRADEQWQGARPMMNATTLPGKIRFEQADQEIVFTVATADWPSDPVGGGGPYKLRGNSPKVWIQSVQFPGRRIDLTWGDYTYRYNAVEAYWNGYAGWGPEPQGNGYGKEAIRSYSAGVIQVRESTPETDSSGIGSRITKYDRRLPVPNWNTGDRWDSTRFDTLITYPDGTATLQRYVEPLQGQFGQGSAADQIQILAHLKHLVAESRDYPTADLAQQDRDRPLSETAAHRIRIMDRLELRSVGNPDGTVLGSSVPSPTRERTWDREAGTLRTLERGGFDRTARSWRYSRESVADQSGAPSGSEMLAPDAWGAISGIYSRLETTNYSPRWDVWLPPLASSRGHQVLDQSSGADGTGLPELPSEEVVAATGDLRWFGRVNSRVQRYGARWDSTTFTYRSDALFDPKALQIRTIRKSIPDYSPSTVNGMTCGVVCSAGVDYDYDLDGNINRITPLGGGTIWGQTVDPLTLKAVEQRDEGNGLTTTVRWDDAGRLSLLQSPELYPTEFSYPSPQQVTQRQQDRKSEFIHNGFGELVREVRWSGSTASHRLFGWNTAGRKIWESTWRSGVGPDASWNGPLQVAGWTYAYDHRGRLVSKVDPNGVATTMRYEGRQRIQTIDSRITTYSSDQLGRLIGVVDALGNYSVYKYNSIDKLTRVFQTDSATGLSQSRSWNYDGLGRLLETSQPEISTWRWSYFDVNDKPWVEDRNGRILTRVYDALARIKKVNSTDGTIDQSFEYDSVGHGKSKGKLTISRDKNISIKSVYNARSGNISDLVTIIGDFVSYQNYDYDIYGNRVKASIDGRVVMTEFDNCKGLPNSVSSVNGLLATAGWDDVTWNLVNLNWTSPGVSSSYSYRRDQIQVAGITHAWSGGSKVWEYEYDNSGRLSSTNRFGEDYYQYDTLNRLVFAKTQRPNGGDLTQEYAYDAFGNLLSVTPGGASSGVASGFAVNRWEQPVYGNNRIPGSLGAWYDPQGNLLGVNLAPNGATRSFEYDALGRVARRMGSGIPEERYGYTPDALLAYTEEGPAGSFGTRRVNLYNDSRQLVSQYEAVGGGALVWKRDVIYLGGKEVAELGADGLKITQTDHLGSPRFLLNSAGALVAEQKYTPFGESLVDNDTAQKFAKGFTGHVQTGASGIIDMQYRKMLPTWGRFTSPDPGWDQNPEDPQSWNLNSYVRNNPVMMTDPTGEAAGGVMYGLGIVYGWARANTGNLLDLYLNPALIAKTSDFSRGERHGTMVALGQAGAEVAAGLTTTTTGGGMAVAGAPGGATAVPGLVVAGGGLLMTAHGAITGTAAAGNLQGMGDGGSAGSGQRSEGPVFKTDKEARAQAESLGYKPVKGEHGKAQVFEKAGKGDGPKYISRDLDGHNGGAFKGANKIGDLWAKKTRSGTYDQNLVRIGR